MANSLTSRLRKAWNVFLNRDPTLDTYRSDIGMSSYYYPDRVRLRRGGERSIIAAVYNRIALDVAAVDIRHIKVDDNNRYVEDVDSKLNQCLSIEANIDQTARNFVQDIVLSMMDEGVVAVVPIDTIGNPLLSNSYDIESLRVGKIVQWYPQYVKINAYNDRTGRHEELVMPKQIVAIIENPFYAVINEPNSILQRLIRKFSLLDIVDEQSSSGKLDLIIQVPYSIHTPAKRKLADERKAEIERQLSSSKYGIGYIDATEHVTQLNRSVENNLLKQIEYLTNLLFSNLHITQSILDGTADEQTMLNYQSRTVVPIIRAITEEMKRKFLTPTARTQKKTIAFFSDPFALVPVSQIAEIADKFTRNEILTSNEIRQIVGIKPSDDPKADELRNKNLSQSNAEIEEEEKIQNEEKQE